MKNAMRTSLLLLVCLLLLGSLGTKAKGLAGDSSLTMEIKHQLQTGTVMQKLYFPKSVVRLYADNNFRAAWIKPQNGSGAAWQAMLMIDCVLQFGLSHADYHPDELTYTQMHDILDTPGKVSIPLQARFDILLTDAILNLMNNLHYGKLNPEFPASRIDSLKDMNFQAGAALSAGLKQKDLLSVIAAAQPTDKLYQAMQWRMHMLEGQLQGDCYEIPEAEVRKLAINMERLRWANTGDSVYIQINIPSFTLIYRTPDSIYRFKVVVGKPQTPTPTLVSAITYMTTAPEWKVPAKIFFNELLPKARKDTAYLENNHFAIYDRSGNFIRSTPENLALISRTPANYFARQSAGCDNTLGLLVFRFANPYAIYLHDTPEKELFNRKDRAYSHGCIRVEQAERLGSLLLRNDGAGARIDLLHQDMSTYIRKDFVLKKPVTLKITYLTCMMINGELQDFGDPYQLDHSLEMAMYGIDQPLTTSLKK